MEKGEGERFNVRIHTRQTALQGGFCLSYYITHTTYHTMYSDSVTVYDVQFTMYNVQGSDSLSISSSISVQCTLVLEYVLISVDVCVISPLNRTDTKVSVGWTPPNPPFIPVRRCFRMFSPRKTKVHSVYGVYGV